MPLLWWIIVRGLGSGCVITALFYAAFHQDTRFRVAYARWYALWALGGGVSAALYWTAMPYLRWHILDTREVLGGLAWFTGALIIGKLLVRTPGHLLATRRKQQQR